MKFWPWSRTTAVVSAVPPANHHVVGFYSEDEALLNLLEEYVREGARLGEVAVVIATAEHRQALRDRLSVHELEDAFLGLDAANVLGRCMVDGMPDRDLFEATVGSLVRDRASQGGLRAYGEMVALLWDQHNVPGTYALEGLWNELQEDVDFPLLCAYPVRDVDDDLGEGLAEVCRLHTHVQRRAS